MKSSRPRSRRKQQGQSIVEYSAVLAFVAIIIACAFSLAQGSFFAGISNSYSNVNAILDRQNRAAMEWGQ
jgi:Flp pilus assembly pilin Flp